MWVFLLKSRKQDLMRTSPPLKHIPFHVCPILLIFYRRKKTFVIDRHSITRSLFGVPPLPPALTSELRRWQNVLGPGSEKKSTYRTSRTIRVKPKTICRRRRVYFTQLSLCSSHIIEQEMHYHPPLLCMLAVLPVQADDAIFQLVQFYLQFFLAWSHAYLAACPIF